MSQFGGMSRGTRLAAAVRRGTVVVPPRDTAVPLSAGASTPGTAPAIGPSRKMPAVSDMRLEREEAGAGERIRISDIRRPLVENRSG